MITLNHIVKEYDKKVILNDINLTIKQGRSVAFTGHNGCGKSTLLKIIAGLVRPTKGTVCLEKRPVIHYVPEHFPKMNLTAAQYLSYMGKLEQLSSAELKTRIHELSEEFFVSDMLNIAMKHLSKGSLQKIAVIQAMIKEPDVLLLDEPLSGQDVMSQQVFIRKIKEMQKHNVTILMSCHEPYLVDAIADEVYEFAEGRFVPANTRLVGEEQWYTMFFVRTEKTKIPESWKGHLQFTEQGCNMRVVERECNRAVMDMLEAGWNLRGMWNEDHE